jgi:hypothetical protein
MSSGKQDFETLKRGFVSRGERKIATWLKARAKIAEFGHHFVQDGMVRIACSTVIGLRV